jgi:hypothetical protein
VGSVDDGVDGGVDAVKFDISSNSIKPEGTKLLAEALKGNQVMAELHLSNNKMTDDGRYVSHMVPTCLADVIPGVIFER